MIFLNVYNYKCWGYCFYFYIFHLNVKLQLNIVLIPIWTLADLLLMSIKLLTKYKLNLYETLLSVLRQNFTRTFLNVFLQPFSGIVVGGFNILWYKSWNGNCKIKTYPFKEGCGEINFSSVCYMCQSRETTGKTLYLLIVMQFLKMYYCFKICLINIY